MSEYDAGYFSGRESCNDEIERLKALLRQWKHAYTDNIDDYEALDAVSDATDEVLGDA